MIKRKFVSVKTKTTLRKRGCTISVSHSVESHSRVYVVGRRKPNALPDPVITKAQVEQFRKDIAQYVREFNE